jgi:hypothetical protein
MERPTPARRASGPEGFYDGPGTGSPTICSTARNGPNVNLS